MDTKAEWPSVLKWMHINLLYVTWPIGFNNYNISLNP